MNNVSPHNVTQLLHNQSDQEALTCLYEIFYPEFHRQAEKWLRHWSADVQLQPTMIVDDVFLKLQAQKQMDWEDRDQFRKWAAQVMRHLLIDFYRRKKADKRGGAITLAPLEEGQDVARETPREISELHDALQELERIDPLKAKVVELKYFGGLTNEEVAQVLGKSTEQVKYLWKLAKGWLAEALRGGDPNGH